MKRFKRFLLVIVILIAVFSFLKRQAIHRVYLTLTLEKSLREVMQSRWGAFFTRGQVFTGNTFYAGRAHEITVFDVTEPKNIRVAKRIPIKGTAHFMAREGNFLYVAAGDAGLLIFNISDKENPRLVSTLENAGYARNVSVKGNVVFAAYETKGLGIVDVKDKTALKLVCYVKLGKVNFVNVRGNTAYVSDVKKGFVTVDVSRPQKPVVLGSVNIAQKEKNEPMDPPPYDIVLLGDFAYAANGYKGFSIINIKNPKKPFLVKHVKTNGYCHNITVKEPYIFLTVQPGTITVLNAKIPENPVVVKHIPGFGGYAPSSFSGNRAIFQTQRTGFSVVEAGNPANPEILGSYNEKATGQGITFYENYLFLSSGSGGLKIFHVKNPEKPVFVSQVDTTAFVHRTFVSFPYAYLADGLGGVTTVNIKNPEKPQLVTSYSFEEHPWDAVVKNNISYLATGIMGLTLYDVTNPAHPVFLSVARLKDDFSMALDVNDKTVFLAGLTGGLYVFDVSNPRHPVLKHHFNDRALDVLARNDFVYLAGIPGEIKILNRHRMKKPVASFKTNGIPSGMDIHDGKLYVADSKKGLFVFDISNPAKLTLLKKVGIKVGAQDVAVNRNVAYVADYENELAVVNLETGKSSYFHEDF